MLRCFIVDSETLSPRDMKKHIPKERSDRIDSFLFMRDKLNSYAAGLFMKAITDSYGGHMVYGDNGKPYVSGNPVYFNISHSGHYVVCAVSDTEVGIDIEMIGDHDDIAKSVMVESELSAYQSIPKEQRNITFCRLWTAKESIMKFLGTGLTLHPKELTVLDNRGLVTEVDGMHIYSADAPDGYCITLCSEDMNLEFIDLEYISQKDLINGDL